MLTEDLTEDCLDRWLVSFDEFRYDFLRYCKLVGKVVGYDIVQDQGALKLAHETWCSQCAIWREHYVRHSKSLSHLKLLAILLFQLAHVEWIKEIREWDEGAELLEWEFRGSPEEKTEVRKDINAGRGTYLALQFVFRVLNWYEHARMDRKKPFVFRLTYDLEHDIMVYLLSDKREEMATYLILKALYVRDPAPASL